MGDQCTWKQQTLNLKHPSTEWLLLLQPRSRLHSDCTSTCLLSWQWQSLRGHTLRACMAAGPRDHRDKHMFPVSLEPWRTVAGKLLTSTHTHTHTTIQDTHKHKIKHTHGQKKMRSVWSIGMHRLLVYRSCLNTGVHVCKQIRERGREREASKQYFEIFMREKNIQIIMSFCFCAKHYICGPCAEREVEGGHQFDDVKFC